MLKPMKCLCLLFVAVMVSGCSFGSEVVVSNTSNNSITIIWSFKEIPCDPNHVFKVVPSELAHKRHIKWSQGKDLNYECDTTDNIGRLELPSNSAVLLIDLINKTLIGKIGKSASENDYSFEIEGDEGTILLKGFQAAKQFGEVRNHRYLLSY